jgi:molecular chaperone IbpA
MPNGSHYLILLNKGDSKMNTRRITTDFLNDPFLIGFDRMIERMRDTAPNQQAYPPYNIVKVDDDQYELQLAIAGFTYDDLDIQIKEGVLTIEGKQETTDDKHYIHRGISGRSFSRIFTLADTVVVNGADLIDGILTVKLENVIPEAKKPRKIEINRGEAQLLKG